MINACRMFLLNFAVCVCPVRGKGIVRLERRVFRLQEQHWLIIFTSRYSARIYDQALLFFVSVPAHQIDLQLFQTLQPTDTPSYMYGTDADTGIHI